MALKPQLKFTYSTHQESSIAMTKNIIDEHTDDFYTKIMSPIFHYPYSILILLNNYQTIFKMIVILII